VIITLPSGATQTASQPSSYILHERAAQFYGAGVGYLSIKSFFGGQATYSVGRSRYTVSERAYLVLNHGQAYDITVESAAPVESFCIFFAPGFAESVRRSLATPADRLLLDPHGAGAVPLTFFEKTYPHDDLLSPTLLEMRRRLVAGAVDTPRLGEQLHELMQRLLHVHHNVYREVARLPAVRAATREELYRRLHLAKEFVESAFDAPLTLDELARVAGLSPNHLLRMFKHAFGQTPHQYLTAKRLEHARHLLAHTNQPVTEICLAVGFASLGAFSWLFRRHIGVSPAEYRRQTR
jgi:AraC-like DNA-binding protein